MPRAAGELRKELNVMQSMAAFSRVGETPRAGLRDALDCRRPELPSQAFRVPQPIASIRMSARVAAMD